MRGFANQPNLAVWYASLDVDKAPADFGDQLRPAQRKRTKAAPGQGPNP